MNTQEYIDSGVLELYAAGGLTTAESAEVEQMAAQHHEVRMALEECLQTMEAYALTHAKAPRPELEDQILRQIESLTPNHREHRSASEAKVIPFTPDTATSGTTQWWQMAAVILLLISAAANVYLYSNLKETRNELVSTRQTSRQYALQVSQLEQKREQSDNLVGVLRNPQTLAVQLNGLPEHPEAQARVFWNRETKEVYFDASALPKTPTGKQYQLWALAGGKPVNAGVVPAVDSTLLQMKPIDEAQAFAVTLEPEGGSENPTMAEMYVMSTINTGE